MFVYTQTKWYNINVKVKYSIVDVVTQILS